MLTKLFLQCLRADYTHVDFASYAVIPDGASLTVLFEDSNGREDWYRNLDFAAEEYGEASVHGGFLFAFSVLESVLSDLLLSPSLRALTLAGYSHGGALATLFHAYIYENRPDLRESLRTVTYGAPRVYRRPPQNALAVFDRLLRVENGGDIVTQLPPSAFGFSHVGHVLSIGEKTAKLSFGAHASESYLRALAERGL